MKTIVFIALLLAGFSMMGQAPDLINYQAVAYNASGQSINNTAISIRISVLQSSSSGTIAYQETHNPATDGVGAFDIQIGGGAVTQGTFAGIDWASHSHYLRVEMDAAGGSNYTVMGTSQMLSVPYAKYAETSGGIRGSNSSGVGYKVYHAPNYELLPAGCDTSTYATPEVIYTVPSGSVTGKIIALDGTYLKSFTYDPITLNVSNAILDSSISVPFNSGTVSANYSTINLIFDLTTPGGSSGTCTQAELMLTEQ